MRQELNRIARGMRISRRANQIVFDENERCWRVRSQSQPHREPYCVSNTLSRGWMCECRDFTQSISSKDKKYCKHIIAVIGSLSRHD
jgi:hypothetical protein